MNEKLTEYLNKIREVRPYLQANFNISDIAIFGSYVRGEEKKDSDLDVLVTFAGTPDLFDLARLSQFLEQKLGIKVDLVPNQNLKPRIARRIYSEKIDIQ